MALNLFRFNPKSSRLAPPAHHENESAWSKAEPQGLLAKRVMDVTGALIGLAISFVPALLIAVLIKLTSRGPIFYLQERVGQQGETFTMIKFRTMAIDAESESGPVWAKPGDPRTTWLGQVLRKTSLDELPQFWNILRGDMSLVGPRPERPYFVEQFEQDVPDYSERHALKPGLTGLAQVNGCRGQSSIYRRTELDLDYVRSQSVTLDLFILAKTIPAVLFQKNSY